ncbi:site-2 protease family protein [Aminobacter sp. BA135]|uniref:site-2 protease family protein n=1 Tax=Aminobacter sp. BA135 TaxID=537596 RepID=UPI003D7904AF
MAGVPVRVHSTFAIPVMLPFLHEWFVRPRHALVFTVIVAVLLFLAVLLHELGHLWAARRSKIAAECIELYLFGGRMFRPFGQIRASWASIYAAGPMVNLALGLLFLAGYYLTAASAGPGLNLAPPPLEPLRLLGWTFALGAVLNLALACLNLLPALPLDGGFIARELSQARLSPQAAMRIVGICGLTLSMLRIVAMLWVASKGFLIWMPPPFGPNWRAARGIQKARPRKPAPEEGETLEWRGKGGRPIRR